MMSPQKTHFCNYQNQNMQSYLFRDFCSQLNNYIGFLMNQLNRFGVNIIVEGKNTRSPIEYFTTWIYIFENIIDYLAKKIDLLPGCSMQYLSNQTAGKVQMKKISFEPKIVFNSSVKELKEFIVCLNDTIVFFNLAEVEKKIEAEPTALILIHFHERYPSDWSIFKRCNVLKKKKQSIKLSNFDLLISNLYLYRLLLEQDLLPEDRKRCQEHITFYEKDLRAFDQNQSVVSTQSFSLVHHLHR